MGNWQRWITVSLAGIFFALTVTTIPRLSLTADEPVYMGAGYAFLRSGDLRMATSAQHPPLMQELVALPLLLQAGPELETLEGWSTAEMARYAPAFLKWYGDALDAATFAARLPVVWVALLWAAFVFRWAADWFGWWGGLIALTLFVFDPNILAHSTLATNDVGFAGLSFVALFAAMRLLRRPSWRYTVVAGVALGGSLSSKSAGFFTALVLIALLPLGVWVGGEGRAGRMRRAILQLACIIILGLLVLWATYGFELRPIAGGSMPIPLATQWEVWREMRGHLAEGHTSYLMGQIRETGWLTYYPLAFALKTPPVTLALVAVGLVWAVAGGPRRWLAMLPLWIYLGGYLAATLLSSVNTGYRFLLPALPLGFILVAGALRERIGALDRSRWQSVRWKRALSWRWGGWATLALLGSAVTVRSHPNYLTYFNFLAGGPTGGHRYLVDSNLDWGQSFKTLREYLDGEEIEQVWLSHYTYADPALYDIRYQPIAPSPGAPPVLPARFNPRPGVYAIGATTLNGVMTVDPDGYSWFRQREAVARPGAAIFVYRVEEPEPRPTWVAQCSIPAAPLSPEVLVEGFGYHDLRVVYFDCSQSWLYPTGGVKPGWTVLHRDTALTGDPFIKRRMDGLSLSYEQRANRASPAFVIYEQPTAKMGGDCAARQPEYHTTGSQSLDGPLGFLGYTATAEAVHPDGTLEVETCWQVTAPAQRPLSLMLHLIGPSGAPVAIGDGLGASIEGWQTGDIFVQRHVLAVPAGAPPGEYTLLTGAYWLDTLERWSVPLQDGTISDRLVLDKITILD